MKALILSLLFFAMAGMGQTSFAWTVSVKAERFHYDIDYSKKSFSYKDAYIQKQWTLKACNKKVFDKVQKDFQTSFKQRIEMKTKKKHADEITYQEDKKTTRIAQASQFGIFLTQFPNRVINLMTEEEHACPSAKKK